MSVMYRIGNRPCYWDRFPWEIFPGRANGLSWKDLGVTRSDYYDWQIDRHMDAYRNSESDLYRDEMLRRADFFAAKKIALGGWKD